VSKKKRDSLNFAAAFHDSDCRFYLALLADQSRRHGLGILGYCLMPNHVHLVAVPERPDSLARALGRAHNLYSRWFNARRGRSGHLWQNRVYSAPLALAQALRGQSRRGAVRRRQPTSRRAACGWA
jgi:putative transposase